MRIFFRVLNFLYFLKEEFTPNKYIYTQFMTLKGQKDIVFW